jgi:hypothetical protein
VLPGFQREKAQTKFTILNVSSIEQSGCVICHGGEDDPAEMGSVSGVDDGSRLLPGEYGDGGTEEDFGAEFARCD